MRSIAAVLSVLAVFPALAKDLRQAPEPEPAPPPQASRPSRPPSEGPVFELKDGTRVVGALAQESFRVDTPYGPLQIPASELQVVRFGTRSDPEMGPRIEALVRQLGDPGYEVREKATAELERTGLAAKKALEAVRESQDAEVRERVERLLGRLEESGEEPPPEEDEVVTARFTVRGDLQCPVFKVRTKYGELTLEKRHIIRLMVRSSAETFTVKVPGNKIISQQYLETPVRLKRGSKLVIRARGNVNLTNWGQACGPAGNPNCGQHMPGIPVGALVGRIGPSGAAFLVGESYEDEAPRDGTLFLAVAVNNNGANNTGEFRVEVTVEESP